MNTPKTPSRTITRYISIGHPGSEDFPKQLLNNRILVHVDLDATTPTRVAKAFRKNLCDTAKWLNDVKPSELWWAVYESVDSGYPILWSENTPLEVSLGKRELVNEGNPYPAEYQKRDILAAIKEPLLTAKELIDLGPKIEKDIKNATRKPRKVK